VSQAAPTSRKNVTKGLRLCGPGKGVLGKSGYGVRKQAGMELKRFPLQTMIMDSCND